MNEQRVSAAVYLRDMLSEYRETIKDIPGDGVAWEYLREPFLVGEEGGEELVANHGTWITHLAEVARPEVAWLMVAFQPSVIAVVADVLEGRASLDDLADALVRVNS